MPDLHTRLRLLEADHEPDGWPAVRMRDVSALLDEVDHLRAAVSAERQRCADLCESISDEYRRRESRAFPEMKTDAETGASDCLHAILAQ